MPSSLLLVVRIPFISHLLNTILLRYIPLSGYLLHIIFHHISLLKLGSQCAAFIRLFSRTVWATLVQHK